MPDPNPQPDPNLQNIDVAKLYELYKDATQHGKIGRRVLRAVILDVLRCKSGGGTVHPFLRWFGVQGHVGAVLGGLIENVSLTEDERQVLDELEKEEKDDQGLSGG